MRSRPRHEVVDEFKESELITTSRTGGRIDIEFTDISTEKEADGGDVDGGQTAADSGIDIADSVNVAVSDQDSASYTQSRGKRR